METRRYLKLGAIGCGSAVLLGLLVAGALMASVYLEYREAALLRAEIDAAHPGPASFTPERSVPEDRLRRFIAVRASLVPRCEEVAELQRVFARMDSYGEMERIPPLDLFRDVGLSIKALPRVGRRYGEYVTARNEALRANGMGLGEYTWIYVVTYYSWLGQAPSQAVQGRHTDVFRERLFPQVREMIRRHVEHAEAGAGLDDWRAELTALERDESRVPFADGLPQEIESALVAHRGELERLACPEAGELDVTLTEKAPFGYDHR